MDIGFGDIITPCPSELDYPNLIDGFPATNILAYSLETVIAEKFQTVIVRAEANSRMKDFYDLYTILLGEKYDSEILSEAINATFENRQTAYVNNHIVFTSDCQQPGFKYTMELVCQETQTSTRAFFS